MANKIIVHLAEDAAPGEAERLAGVKVDPNTVAVGDQVTAEDGTTFRVVRVDRRRATESA